MRKCMPASMKRFQKTITTRRQTLRKQVNTPQTNIKTSTYTIGGVDTSQTDMGLITKTQVSKGRFLSKKNAREALVANSYASSHKLKVGSTLSIKKTTFRVVGLVQAPLGGQSADVYVPLKQLQTLAGQKNQINVVLVRASKSSGVGAVEKKIKSALPSAQVASNKSEADQISGSLVTASNLAKSLGLALSIIVIAMAIMLAALLTLSSVAKRCARDRDAARTGLVEKARDQANNRRVPDSGRYRRCGRRGNRHSRGRRYQLLQPFSLGFIEGR